MANVRIMIPIERVRTMTDVLEAAALAEVDRERVASAAGDMTDARAHALRAASLWRTLAEIPDPAIGRTLAERRDYLRTRAEESEAREAELFREIVGREGRCPQCSGPTTRYEGNLQWRCATCRGEAA